MSAVVGYYTDEGFREGLVEDDAQCAGVIPPDVRLYPEFRIRLGDGPKVVVLNDGLRKSVVGYNTSWGLATDYVTSAKEGSHYRIDFIVDG